MFAVVWTNTDGERYDGETYEHGGDAATVSKRVNAELAAAGDDRRTRVVKLDPSECADVETVTAYGHTGADAVPYGGAAAAFVRDDEAAREWYAGRPGETYGEYMDRRRHNAGRIPADGITWRRREFGRDVMRPDWIGADWYVESDVYALHYPYVSEVDPSKLCYTQSEQHGRDDRQTRTTPGRYLKQHFGDVLTDAEIQRLALEWSTTFAPRELKLATTPDDVERVYVNGPRSCMSHAAHSFDSPEHPTRVYAAGDLAVAYLADPDDASHITARGICWPERATYAEYGMYGDTARLRGALHDAGYEPGSMDGARLLRIECGGGFVVPYLDIADGITDDGDYLRVGGYDIDASSTCGVSGNRAYCDACGEGFDPEYNSYATVDGDMWCHGCCECSAVFCCECEEYTHAENASEVRGRYGTDWACSVCVSDWYGECAECAEIHHLDGVCEGPDGETLCDGCARELVTACDVCYADVYTDDVAECDDGYACAECAADMDDGDDGDTADPTHGRRRYVPPVPDSTDPAQYVCIAPGASSRTYRVIPADSREVRTLAGRWYTPPVAGCPHVEDPGRPYQYAVLHSHAFEDPRAGRPVVVAATGPHAGAVVPYFTADIPDNLASIRRGTLGGRRVYTVREGYAFVTRPDGRDVLRYPDGVHEHADACPSHPWPCQTVPTRYHGTSLASTIEWHTDPTRYYSCAHNRMAHGPV